MKASRSVGLVLGLVVLGASVSCGGAPGSSGASRGQAKAVIPAWVPAAATDLKHAADSASEAFWIRFRLPAADRPALEAELNRIPDEQVATLTFPVPKGADWWFRGLVQVVPAREPTLIAADVYSGAGRSIPIRVFVAFDRASDTVYAWSPER